MPQAVSPLLFLLPLMGYALAGLNIWPSLHVALSNGSVFVDFKSKCNGGSLRKHSLSLINTETNTTAQTRTLSNGQSTGRVEFDCSCFLYAGTFRFLLQQTCATLVSRSNGTHSKDSTVQWWSSELRVQWPTFHIALKRAGNQSRSFQVWISTNEHFRACSSVLGSALYLEVSYVEHNQIGRNSIDKVQARTEHPVRLVRSQSIELLCAFPFTDKDFIRVSLRSPHSTQEVKRSEPLYLTRLFFYKLLVENAPKYKSGCEGMMTVKLMSPPCAHINGKILLYKDGTEEPANPPLAFNWLTPGENETEFNCSLFSTGRNKYCFQFVLNFSRSPSPAQTCLVVHKSADSWGPWQQWSVCSATCGEGVRERVRKCLLPSSAGGMECTGMVKEQSHCSLENCAALPAPSPSLPSSSAASLGGNMVVVAGISLCLAVIVATIVVTLWRKLCQTPQCSSVRRSSMHSPGGRKLSDEASICGHSLPRPSLFDNRGPQSDRPAAEAQAPPLPLAQDPERLSPSGQKMLPTIYGYHLAQQQLKEMKKIGLKEATQLYHVSSSPVQDTMLATPTISPIPSPTGFILSASTPEIHTGVIHGERPPKSQERLSPRAELVLGPSISGHKTFGSSKSRDRTAEWVEMVERSGLGGLRRGVGAEAGLRNMSNNNASFRRTSSFNDPKPHLVTSAQFRERSMTQVGSRTLPEGSSWTRRGKDWQPHYSYPIPENGISECLQPGPQRKTWLDKSASFHTTELKHTGTNTQVSTPEAKPELSERCRVEEGISGIGGPAAGLVQGGNQLSVDRAEQNWNRRGPSPIQRNILARKLKEAQSSASSKGRQRSSTFSVSPSVQKKERCSSQRMSEVYSTMDRSSYRLSEAEQRMLDLDLSST